MKTYEIYSNGYLIAITKVDVNSVRELENAGFNLKIKEDK
jgi:hypothetical protein